MDHEGLVAEHTASIEEQLSLPFPIASESAPEPVLTVELLLTKVQETSKGSDPQHDLELILDAAHGALGEKDLRRFERKLSSAKFKALKPKQMKEIVEAARTRAAKRDPTRDAEVGHSLKDIESVIERCHFIKERLPRLGSISGDERAEVLSVLAHFEGAADAIGQRGSSIRLEDGTLDPDMLAELKAAEATYPRTCEYLRGSLCKGDHPACFVKSPARWPERIKELEPYHFEEMTVIRPALAFPVGTALVAQAFIEDKESSDGAIYQAAVPKLITADGRILPFSERLSDDPGEIIRVEGKDWVLAGDPPVAMRSRWSKTGVQDFLLSRCPRVDPGRLYLETYKLVRRYSWLKDERETHLVVLYIFLTYFHSMFPAVAYLYLQGIWGGGKSTLARVIAHLAFNGWYVVQPSGPALYRTVEAEQCTIVIDEKEDITNRKQARESDLVPILKAGYQAGAKVPRCNPSRGNRVELFEAFSPKVIANIFGLEEVLSDRCVSVHCREASKEALDALEKRQPDENDPRFQRLRDQFYLLVMQYHRQFRECYEACLKKDILGTKLRDNELFLPLAVVARFVEDHGSAPIELNGSQVQLTSLLASLVHQKVEQRAMQKSEAPELVLNSALHGLLDAVDKDVEWFHACEIQRGFDLHYSQPPEFATDIWIGKAMRQTLGLVRKPIECERQYVMTKPRIAHAGAVPGVLERKRPRFYRVDRSLLRERAHDDGRAPRKKHKGREEMEEREAAVGGFNYADVLDDMTDVRKKLEAEYRRKLGDEVLSEGMTEAG